MTEGKRDVWFPAKKCGWGWRLPCAWQGWVVMLVYIGLVVATSIVIKSAVSLKMYLAIILGLSFLFYLVCWWKGEKPAWRWGDQK